MPESMKDVLELADKLGQALARTERFQALAEVNSKLRDDAELRKLHEQYVEQEKKIQQLLSQGKPVEVEDKKTLSDLQDKLRSSPLMQQLARAEADYTEMMSRVSRAINNPMDEQLGAPGVEPAE